MFGNKKTSPIKPIKTRRRDSLRVLSSFDAGVVAPVGLIPLHREDAIQRASVDVAVQMAETARPLFNDVICTVKAVLVPYLAFERFNGMDQLNRSYQGVPESEGGDVVPFVTTFNSTTQFRPVLDTLGIHVRPNVPFNAAPVEAYNTWVNFERAIVSKKLPQETPYGAALKTCLWPRSMMRHIVPEYDQALADAEVPLSIVDPKINIEGLIRSSVAAPSGTYREMHADGTETVHGSQGPNQRALYVDVNDAAPRIWGELQQNGISVSLANIRAVEKTQAFAKLKAQYTGIVDEEYLIDLLMDGINVPEAALAQPILLASKELTFSTSTRYSTEAASLDQSVTSAVASTRLTLRVPPINTGGVVLILVECVPEQLFERQQDYFVQATSVSDFPSFLRDYLDAEKVAVVPNSHVDVKHSLPDATFGYAPLNHQWMRDTPRVGGRYMRPDSDVFVEDRQQIWTVEQANPTLGPDFYLASNMHKKVFADQSRDAFDVMVRGHFDIVGNTVFGERLLEGNGEFESVNDDADYTRNEETSV